MAVENDKQVIGKLNALLQAASNEADRWSREHPDRSKEEHEYYRARCYQMVDTQFWDVVRQLDMRPPDRPLELGPAQAYITSHLEAFIHRSWVDMALEDYVLKDGND